MNTELLNKIKKLIGSDNVLEQEPMKLHTSMEVGGPAECLLRPGSIEEVSGLLRILNEAEYPYFIKGNGSNLIVRDEGYPGAIIEMMRMNRIRTAGECIEAECGALLKDISEAAVSASLSGFEFASGIPGSLGGAVTMNAGAYDGEMKDIIREVTLLDKNGNLLAKSGPEMDFSYRHSICSGGDFIVLSACFQLKPGNPAEIQKRIDELSEQRRSKQPLEFPSCGSTFKRPEGYFAGTLISDAGLKGFRLGGAQVSEKHAGFVINRENATASEVLDLIAHIQKTVKEQFGVELQCEVKII
ncbi:MAG: UDP-N-acetylmuramate dehydrogenase [Parasporobacterium sp.]|nr:UDP-N-acetylmuramate dehydrogenase [Parasporobacterium sp.]